MAQGKWVDVLGAPRWAGLSSFIKDECWRRGVELQIEIEKGWIRETSRIKITGPEETVTRLKRDVYAAMDGYNDRLEQRHAR